MREMRLTAALVYSSVRGRRPSCPRARAV